MSSIYKFRRVLFIAGIACPIFFITGLSQGSVSGRQSNKSHLNETPALTRNYRSDGRLVVQRVANFGTDLFVNPRIDGREVANIGRNRQFETSLSPGRHVLTVMAVPNSNVRWPTSRRIVVEPGYTYVFTALWSSDRVVLRRSGFSQ